MPLVGSFYNFITFTVNEMAKKFENFAETRNSDFLREEKTLKKETETGNVFKNKLSYIDCSTRAVEDIENNYILLEGKTLISFTGFFFKMIV